MFHDPFPLRAETVKLIRRLLSPLMDYGLVSNREYDTIVTSLSYIVKHGTPMPAVVPRLISTQEAAEMLGISSSQFRALERGRIPVQTPLRRR